MCCIPICLVASGRADTSRHLRMPCTPVGSESSRSKSRCVRDDSSDASARLSQTRGVRTASAGQCRPRRLPAGGLRQHRSSGCCLSLGGHIPHPFARDCTTNPAPARYGRRMVQERWTSRYLLATLSLAVKVRWPVWATIGTLLAGTIPLLGVILEHFRTK